MSPAGSVVPLRADDPEGVVVTADSTLIVVAARRPSELLVVGVRDRHLTARPLPGAARHLQLDGDDVLVPGEDTSTLDVVDPVTGSVLASTPVGPHPHDAVEVKGTEVVTEENGHGLGFVRAGRLVGRITGLDTPGGITCDGDRAAAVEVRGRVLTVVDVPRERVIAKVPVGAGPTHVVDLGDGLVAVADTSGDQVIVVQVQGKPHVVTRLHLAGKPYGMAYDRDRRFLWVATGADNVLHQIAVDGTQLTPGATFDTVRQPNSLAVIPATGAVVVVGATSPGALQVIDP